MAPTVNQLAELMMTHPNDAAAVNGLTLSALALLAAERHALTRDELQAQLNTYLDLLKQVPYSPNSTMPAGDAKTLLDQAMELNKFEVTEDKLGQIISLDRYQAILLTYYRNNILHLFAMPSLVAALIERCEGLSRNGSSPAVSTSTRCSRRNCSCVMKRRRCPSWSTPCWASCSASS